MAESGKSQAGHSRRPRLGVWIASAATLVGLATGVLTLKDQIFGSGSDAPTPAAPRTAAPRTVPKFEGVVGQVERSQDFIGFLQTHDGDAVELKAGFQIALDDYAVEGFGQQGVDPDSRYIRLMTECNLPLTEAEQDEVDLGMRDQLMPGRCGGTELFVTGRDTDESGIYVSHGSPRLEGYFVVRSGDLHQGFRGMTLKPISFDEAIARA
jgi:hypothetical protein